MGRTVLDLLQKSFGSPATSLAQLTPEDPGIIALAKLRGHDITPFQELGMIRGEIFDPFAAQARAHIGGDFFSTTLPNILKPIVSAVNPFAAAAITLGSALEKQANAPRVFVPKPSTVPQIGGRPMAFADGDSGFFSGIDFGQIFQGLGQPLLQLGTQAATGFINQQFAPQPVSFPQANMAAVPAIARGGAMVARGFFNRFPNLATAIQRLRNAGANVTRASLWNLMKRFGPDFLISGSILTAAAVSELAMAGPGRRRMNPGNIKALRKAHRRMKAFHHVCRSNDMLLGGSKRRRSTPSGSSVTRITQVK